MLKNYIIYKYINNIAWADPIIQIADFSLTWAVFCVYDWKQTHLRGIG